MRSGILAITMAALMSTSASAAIQWTDWTSVANNVATGSLDGGTVTMDGPFDTYSVAGGFDYWRNGPNPWPAYDGVSNMPTNGDFIAPSGNTVTHTITFSKPIRDPYFAIISLGQPGIQTSWTFSDAFSLVDQGQGYWGNGVFTINGNSISAGEAHGIIQFKGNFTSLTLTTNRTENWSGLTIGTPGVPEPASWAMLITGFGLVGAAARRRRAVAA
ncbi:PEPxxWA-CTERM sorting domain-containing protein [Sandarakinorhabdus oryzae]|uniref:PEPxxWA-CTERM sorting domain-containing protein n=1 Tax=Sandarakinorhabdus oryzae TaxID=2675220 RepID=UPI001F4719FF|nr:PEPxxWA-CTERM sorting domain-containing protein [Sandarakinorhabdus oryzae]